MDPVKKGILDQPSSMLGFSTGLISSGSSFCCGSVETNLTSVHEDAGLIPGLALWVPPCAVGVALKSKKKKQQPLAHPSVTPSFNSLLLPKMGYCEDQDNSGQQSLDINEHALVMTVRCMHTHTQGMTEHQGLSICFALWKQAGLANTLGRMSFGNLLNVNN